LKPSQIIEILRATTFGGLVGAGIGTILYLRFPEYFTIIGPYWFIGGCGALGTGLQQAIERTLRFVFKPPFKVITFHEKLQELDQLRDHKRISPATHEHLVKSLCEKRYLE
jgi:hypothetical protein